MPYAEGMKRWWILAGLLGGLWAQAQTVTVGLYGRPDYASPTLEVNWPLEAFTLGAWAYREGGGVSLDGSLELGPLGRLTYGGQLGLLPLGWQAQGRLGASLGPVALEGSLAYRQFPTLCCAPIPMAVWSPEGPAMIAWLAQVQARYRTAPRETLTTRLDWADGVWKGEGSYAWRGSDTLTLGAGYAPGWYGLVGWKGEVDEAGNLLEAYLRAGEYNQAQLRLFVQDTEPNLKLSLTLDYPWAGKVELEALPLTLEGGLNPMGWSAWLRYTFDFGGEP